jgi:hypothetical protein
MSKLLLVAALVLSVLACDATNEPTAAGDASVDSLPPIKVDGGADSKPGVGTDTKPEVVGTACSIPATAGSNFGKVSSGYITVSNDVNVLCNALNQQQGANALYGLNCGHPELNWAAGGNGGFCLVVSGPDVNGMYQATGMGYAVPLTRATTTEACSISGVFQGWTCF